MSLECLPTEIFLQIFNFLTLREIVTAFSGLNSYINSIIRLVRNASHEVRYNDPDAIKLLHLFSTNIGRLVVVNVEMVDFTSLINLHSLTLKYGTKTQIESICSEHFPLLEILHINGLHRTVSNYKETIDNFLKVLLSNGFLRLRICTILRMGFLICTFNNTWTGLSNLRILNLWLEKSLSYGQLRSICPRLRRLTTNRHSMDEQTTAISISVLLSEMKKSNGITYQYLKRFFWEMAMLERLKTENRIIIDVNPLTPLSDEKVPSRFNNTTNTPRSNATHMFTFQARILPQTEPYCHASFLIEIGLANEYPFKAPEIILLDPIYHPCIAESGRHNCSWGFIRDKAAYNPRMHLMDMIDHFINFIDNTPDPRDIVNCQRFEEYQNDYKTFYNEALELTLSYGRPRD